MHILQFQKDKIAESVRFSADTIQLKLSKVRDIVVGMIKEKEREREQVAYRTSVEGSKFNIIGENSMVESRLSEVSMDR